MTTQLATPPTNDLPFADLSTGKILIVDDEITNVKIVHKYLSQEGYTRFVTTTDSRQAVSLIRSESPDVILLDVIMPEVNGLEILEQVRSDQRLRHIPVLILTASSDPETKQRALQLGVTDFLAKPVDPADLYPRVRNALAAKAHHDHLERYAERLEQEVRLRTAELEASRQDIILCLARAGEYRDQETGNHVIRVGLYAGIVARELGMDENSASLLEQAALLHDVGKIGVSDLILLKPGQLSKDEFEMMKKHCVYGGDIIQPKSDIRWRRVGRKKGPMENIPVGTSPIMAMAARIARSHHERWDGTGYPDGLRGEEIPLEGRIVAVVDVFDALSSVRPYKEAIPTDRCIEILSEGRDSHFDPAVYDAFIRAKDEILLIQDEFMDTVDEQEEVQHIEQIAQVGAQFDTATQSHNHETHAPSASDLRRAFSSNRSRRDA